jgi:hypothetical protein
MADLTPKDFSLSYDINRRKIQRYISIIKNRLSDLNMYNITITYQRSYKIYRCYINT